jgi:hypothetical protein
MDWKKREFILLPAGVVEVSGRKEDVRPILSVIAIEKGLLAHGKFLVNLSEDELIDIESNP